MIKIVECEPGQGMALDDGDKLKIALLLGAFIYHFINTPRNTLLNDIQLNQMKVRCKPDNDKRI